VSETAASIEPIYISIGARLRDARIDAGWTQDEVAGWVDLSRTSVTNVEIGRQRLMLHQIVIYADVMSIPLGELIGSAVDTTNAKLRAENATLRRRVGALEQAMRSVAASAADVMDK
jgi:transcriptional regulator with XRE-family HTH domain